MEIAGTLPIILTHLCVSLMCIENNLRVIIIYLYIWRRQLKQLCLGNNFIVSTATFLAHTNPPHKRSQNLVTRNRWMINKALFLDKRRTWIGNFHAIIKNFNHRTGSTNKKVLMDNSIRY